MMKNLVSALLIVIGFGANAALAQNIVPYDSVKKQIIYTEVVQVPGANKDKLFERGERTLNGIFKEAGKKFDALDKEKGQITMKCTTRVMLKDPKTKMMVASKEFIKYKITLSIKDGKYKYDFYDFHIDKGGHKFPIERFVEKHHTVTKETRADEQLEYLNQDIKGVIAKLKDGMKSDKVATKEDW